VKYKELQEMMSRHGLTTGVLWDYASSDGLDRYGASKGLPRKRFESDERYKARLIIDAIIAECAKAKYGGVNH
jgi:hypothetical protein